MDCSVWAPWLLTVSFIVGYLLITFEHVIRLDKAAIALLCATVMWAILFTQGCLGHELGMVALQHHLYDVSQIVFFLFGALAIVEGINAHHGFSVLLRLFDVSSQRTLLWLIGTVTFFLSAVLDNLTTTIVMLSLLRQLMPSGEARWIIGSGIVIAANAGGAWTPIGDVTTTMLWIGGQLSVGAMLSQLFLPSLVCHIVGLFCLSWFLKGQVLSRGQEDELPTIAPGGIAVLALGIGILVSVPIFKVLTGLPPFMGIFFGWSIFWLFLEWYHGSSETRAHLKMNRIFQHLDFPSLLFFCGILLAVAALTSAGILSNLAGWLDAHVSSVELVATTIGLASAVVDNVPLVAASMGMYPLDVFPTDHTLWLLIAYCAGTGGSILIIGSAAGVVYMGIEKVTFTWFLRRASLPALMGYLAGIGTYLLTG